MQSLVKEVAESGVAPMTPARTISTRQTAKPISIVALIGFILIWIVFRAWCAMHFRVDSDEPQHLHVVWAWAHGFVQYRDFFDNHMPLFHLLCVPLLQLIGERADVIVLMRLAMFPLYAASLLCTFFIGRSLGSSWNGLCAAMLSGLLPLYFLRSLEFRADDLWSLLWLIALAVMAQSSLTQGRSFAVGFLLGLAVAVSLKTILLLVALAFAGIMTFSLVRDRMQTPSVASWAMRFITGFGGVLIAPAVVLGIYASEGSASHLWTDAIAHNVTAIAGDWAPKAARALVVPPAFAILWLWGRRWLECFADRDIAARALMIFLSNGIFLALLFGLWPRVTSQDLLPVLPPLILSLVPIATGELAGPAVGEFSAPRKARRLALPGALAAIEVASLLFIAKPWRDHVGPNQNQLLKEVLALTDPDQLVADAKGETVYRQRSTYYVLETVTLDQMARGTLADDIPERLIATKTCVVNRTHFPTRANAFVKANYINVGRLRVLGQFFRPKKSQMRQALSFTVTIPARYSFMSPSGPLEGVLDGGTLQGSRELAPGVHSFLPSRDERLFALIWTQAVERGFKPIWPLNPPS